MQHHLVNDRMWHTRQPRLGKIMKIRGYGLRVSFGSDEPATPNESLGQRLGDIRIKHIEVQTQLDHFETTGDGDNKAVIATHKPVKDKEMRKVPHWVIKPAEAYALVDQIQKFSIHPDTLTKHFIGLTEELFGKEGRYLYHDLSLAGTSLFNCDCVLHSCTFLFFNHLCAPNPLLL